MHAISSAEGNNKVLSPEGCIQDGWSLIVLYSTVLDTQQKGGPS